jgi:hypothetical protein
MVWHIQLNAGILLQPVHDSSGVRFTVWLVPLPGPPTTFLSLLLLLLAIGLLLLTRRNAFTMLRLTHCCRNRIPAVAALRGPMEAKLRCSSVTAQLWSHAAVVAAAAVPAGLKHSCQHDFNLPAPQLYHSSLDVT